MSQARKSHIKFHNKDGPEQLEFDDEIIERSDRSRFQLGSGNQTTVGVMINGHMGQLDREGRNSTGGGGGAELPAG